jgi:creatinine amidohydrolase
MSEPEKSHRLGDISSAAFAGSAKTNPVILLPLGSHEDHGPHLPMGDYKLAESLAVRIAAAAAAAGTACFVAPCLPFGVADYFGSSPGGLALSAANFRGVLSDLLSGLMRHGLTKILILNGHGGNVPVIHEVTLALKNSENIIIPSFYLWKVARSLMETRLGAGQGSRFGHGAEPLLSLSLALRPGQVHSAHLAGKSGQMLGLPVSGFGVVDFQGLPIDVPAAFDQVPDTAIRAAWPAASAALGEAVAAELVSIASQFVTHFAGANAGQEDASQLSQKP